MISYLVHVVLNLGLLNDNNQIKIMNVSVVVIKAYLSMNSLRSSIRNKHGVLFIRL